MAVKIDKEALIKHRFWIMLGVAVPLILVAMYVLRIDIATSIAAAQKKTDAALKAVKGYTGNFPSQEEIDKLGEEVKKANAEVGTVWGNVFRKQEPYMFWPDEFVKIHPFDTGKFIREIKETTEVATTDPTHFIGTFIEPYRKPRKTTTSGHQGEGRQGGEILPHRQLRKAVPGTEGRQEVRHLLPDRPLLQRSTHGQRAGRLRPVLPHPDSTHSRHRRAGQR